jgi:hypothetical protein
LERVPEPSKFGRLKGKISDTLSHATYVEYDDLNWPLWTIINDVLTELERLRSDYLSPASRPGQMRLQVAITDGRALFASVPPPPNQ